MDMARVLHPVRQRDLLPRLYQGAVERKSGDSVSRVARWDELRTAHGEDWGGNRVARRMSALNGQSGRHTLNWSGRRAVVFRGARPFRRRGGGGSRKVNFNMADCQDSSR